MAEEKIKKAEEKVQEIEENKTKEKKSEITEETKKSEELKSKSKKTVEEKIELEREYIVPLRKEFLKAPRYRRAKRAVRTIKEFLARHMKVENRDINKVKINIHLNNEVWFRGIKKPANKIKVKAVKKGGIVYAELAEIPEIIQYKISREIKRKANVGKVKMPKHDDLKEERSDKANKTEESEKEKASKEAGLEKQKQDAKTQKHVSKGPHENKTMPVRKSLKK